MTSFIELPRLHFDGREQPSIYVNVADIISLVEHYDRQTKVEVRSLGSDGMSAAFTTYMPLLVLLDTLGDMAGRPGVRSWADSVKSAFAAPIVAALKEAAAKERAASHAAR